MANPETSPKGMARSARRFLRLTKICLFLSVLSTLFLGLCFSWHWPVLSALASIPFLFVLVGLTCSFMKYEPPFPYEGRVIHYVEVSLPAVYFGRRREFERARIMRKRMRRRIRWFYSWRRWHRFDRLRFVCMDPSVGRYAVVASLSAKHREPMQVETKEETLASSG